MTREEAIKALERAEDYAGIQCVNSCVDAYISPYLLKAIDFAVAESRKKNPGVEAIYLICYEMAEYDFYMEYFKEKIKEKK